MINKAILLGNLGGAPEFKKISEEMSVCNFSLATSKKVKGEDQTTWHNVKAFGKLAEICSKYLDKGSRVYVEGEIQQRSWEAQDGSKRYRTEIVINDMKMLSSKEERVQPDQPAANVQNANEIQLDENGLPF